MNYTSITLGELLSSKNETIKRNAMSILKTLQKKTIVDIDIQTGEKVALCYCHDSGLSIPHYADDHL